MGKDTLIQWCDSTANPTTGCDGCELHVPGKGGPCYAGVQHEGRMAKVLPVLYAPSFTEVRLAPGRMKEAAGWSDLRGKARPGKPWVPPDLPRLVFVSDMSDALSAAVPFEYLRTEIIDHVTSPRGRRHIWQWLSKRPSRMVEFGRWLSERGVLWPANLWAGTSVTGSASLKRLDQLLEVPSRVHFASIEPLREAISLLPWFDPTGACCGGEPEYRCPGCPAAARWIHGQASAADPYYRPTLDLVLIGGESRQAGHDPRPFDVQWARDLIGQCRDAGVAPFVKQLGSLAYDSAGPGLDFCAANILELRDGHGGDWSEWPADLRVREFPQLEGVYGA